MSPNNRKSFNALFISLLGLVLLPLSTLAGGLGDASVISHKGTKMLAGTLMIRLTEDIDVERPERYLPADHTLLSRLLPPEQTVTYGRRPIRRTTVSAALLSAERRLLRTVIVRYAGPIHPLAAAAAAMKHPYVEFAEPYYVAEEQATPNDPLFGQQAALTLIRMQQAWDIEQGNASIVIGISDNGVDQEHEDLAPSLWTNTGEIPNNGKDDDGNGYVDDHQGYNFAWQDDGTQPGVTFNQGNNGHGTKVAGIVSASTNNGKGIAGVAYKCRMFPMKTARKNVAGIIYGYQSLIYAAQMGFKVVNCSWGVVKPWSPVDQSVIDLCLANGVLVVASAGNHGSSGTTDAFNYLNFPSAYDGVLGVGETTTDDRVTASSGLGLNALVMAPGNRAMTTDAGGGYTQTGVTGTSFAAPMAAGVAALVRSKHATMTPRQVIEHLRNTTDNIDVNNLPLASVLSGRINAERALTDAPLARPGFRIAAVRRTFPDGRLAERWSAGDTLDMTYTVVNELGSASNAVFSMDVADPNGWEVTAPTTNAVVGAIATGQRIDVGPFRFVIRALNDRSCMLRLNAFDDDYEGECLDRIQPPSVMSVMQNDELMYSIGDNGTFGFSNGTAERQGVGFAWVDREWLLSPSGLLFSESNSRVLKGYNNLTFTSDFVVEKGFIDPDRQRGVMSDAGIGSKEIGVRIAQRASFPSASSRATVIEVDIENRSGSTLNDVAAGYFLDWDIGYAGQNNRTRLAPEALPTTFRETGEAQLFYREGASVAVVCAAVTNEIALAGQAAGMMLWDIVDDADGLTDADVIQLLSSGTSIQTTEIGDVCGVIGMRFPGPLTAGAHRRFMIVISVGATIEEATTTCRETILEPNTVDDRSVLQARMWPQPVSDMMNVSLSSEASSVQVIDVMGRVRMDLDSEGRRDLTIATEVLESGTFYLVITSSQGLTALPFTVLH
jgi:hypothetical protein